MGTDPLTQSAVATTEDASSRPVANEDRVAGVDQEARATAARAAGLLPRLNKEDIPAMVRYIATASKDPLARTDFVQAYLEASSRIIEAAREFILAGNSITGLMQYRNVLVRDLTPLATPVVPATSEWLSIQQSYENAVQGVIRGLVTAGADDPELRLRALNLAIIALRVQSRKEDFASLISGEGRERLLKYKGIMDRAYRSAAQRHGENFTVEDRLAAFVELAIDRTGKCPRLRVFNDFDGNLTQVPESGSPWKPGEQTNGLLNTLDRAAQLPMFVRLVTTELPGLNPTTRQLAAKLYAIAARQSVLYEDVQDLFHGTVSITGVEHNILTANHEGLVNAKLLEIGRSRDVRVEAVGQLDWYGSKVERLLLEIMRDDNLDIFLFADDNDGPVAAHLEAMEPVVPKGKEGTDPVYFHDLLFLASRHSTAHATRVGDVLVKKGIDHVDLCREPTATGFKGFGRLKNFIERYQRTRAEEEPVKLNIRFPNYYTSGDNHIAGDVVRRCRQQERLLHQDGTLPKPDTRTIIKPIQDRSLVGSHQFDLGSATAVYDSSQDCWVVLYKAASEPSGSRPMTEPSPSNVFAARYYVSEGRVEFFDHHRSSRSQLWMEPFLTSDLPLEFSRDGLHDPRATTMPNGLTLILACAFNKQEEQLSIRQAAGDLSKPIRGAVTELFVTANPSDPQSYQSKGVFGPDFHFKNMVFFPERIDVNGNKRLVALCRKMPGIQAIPIPDEAINDTATWSTQRIQFWNDVLTPESVAKYHVLAPEFAYEGRFNPNAPGRLGQVAPGLAPIKVVDPRSGARNRNYWLMVYNSVPDFKPDASGTAKGRVIGAALLDYRDPWTVVARSPVPIITGRSERAVLEGDGIMSRHSDVAFCGGGGVDAQGRLSVFYTEDDSIIRCATYPSIADLVMYLLKFDSRGQQV